MPAFVVYLHYNIIMARNQLNHLKYCKKVTEIVNQYYEEGWTTYAAVWRRYVNPVYPMSYQTFIKIINMTNLNGRIAEAEARTSDKQKRRMITAKNQLSLFD